MERVSSSTGDHYASTSAEELYHVASSTTKMTVVQLRLDENMTYQMEVRCVENFLPPRGRLSAQSKVSWMWSTIAIVDQGSILGPAMAALCLARVGVSLANQDLILRARSRYVLALRKLMESLSSTSHILDPRTLAAMRALCIYEVSRKASCNGFS